MKELKIMDKDLLQFKRIIDAYQSITKYPIKNRWKKLDNNEIWYWMIGQIIVVGGSAGGKRFWQNEALRKQISFDNLLNIQKESAIKKRIHMALREVGARYSSEELHKCAKTKALVHNLNFVKEFKNGLTGLLVNLDNLKGNNCEHERVYFLMENLKFFKNKSARDFLMNLGMNRNTLAIDVRIQNIFNHLKIEFPGPNLLGRKDVYEAMEAEMISKICKPLKIQPLNFDRILYQNYFKIIKNDFLQIKMNFK